MTNERGVKDAVKRLLKSYGHAVWYVMPLGQMYGKAGVPDFICCVKGHDGDARMFAVETKYGRNKPTKLQELEMQAIEAAGGRSFVINETNVDTLRLWLDGVLGIE